MARKSAKKFGQLDAVKLFPSVSNAVGNDELLLLEVDLVVNNSGADVSIESSDCCCMGEQKLFVIKNKIKVSCNKTPASLLLDVGDMIDRSISDNRVGVVIIDVYVVI